MTGREPGRTASQARAARAAPPPGAAAPGGVCGLLVPLLEGSLSIRAAERFGARVDAVTLSAAQRHFVTGRVHDVGLGKLVTVKEMDYREGSGKRYDAIAAIEMGEHVGARQYPQFCARLRGLLAPGGRLLIQQMSRAGRAPGGGPFAWLANFREHRDEITRLIGGEQVRVWELNLNGGAQAFEQGRMGVDQVLAVRGAG